MILQTKIDHFNNLTEINETEKLFDNIYTTMAYLTNVLVTNTKDLKN